LRNFKQNFQLLQVNLKNRNFLILSLEFQNVNLKNFYFFLFNFQLIDFQKLIFVNAIDCDFLLFFDLIFFSLVTKNEFEDCVFLLLCLSQHFLCFFKFFFMIYHLMLRFNLKNFESEFLSSFLTIIWLMNHSLNWLSYDSC